MKVLGWVGIIILAAACNNAPPNATAYKQQLGAPAGATGNNSGNATGGNATNGQALFTSKGCGGCHNGTIGKDFAKTPGTYTIDATSQAKNPAHTADNFSGANAADLEAYIKTLSGGGTAAGGLTGNATNGNTLLTANCLGCHPDAGGGAGPRLDSTVAKLSDKVDGNASHAGVAAFFAGQNEADILAALKAVAP